MILKIRIFLSFNLILEDLPEKEEIGVVYRKNKTI